jgi:YjjG family noncanonical pyrimidine nucleotidase
MHQYKAIFFDLDETLLDFKASQRAALMRTQTLYFQNACDFDSLLATFGHINKGLWSRVEAGEIGPTDVKYMRFEALIEALQLNFSPSLGLEIAEFYEASLSLSAICLPKAKETLTRLKSSHRIGIITNGLSLVQHSRIRLAGFEQLVDSVIVSEELGVAKPNKAVFEAALLRFGLSASQCLMVGDSLTSDYQGALNAGMDFCWINAQGSSLPHDMPAPTWILPNIAKWPFLEELEG